MPCFGAALPSATRPRHARPTWHKVFYRRKNGPQRQPRLAGNVERGRPRSPIWRRRIVKTWKSQYDAGTPLLHLHERTHALLLYALLRCCTWWVSGSGAVRTASSAVILLYISTPNSAYGKRRKDPSPRGIATTKKNKKNITMQPRPLR